MLGPYNKDPTIQGTRFGSSIFGNSHPYIYIYSIRLSLWNTDYYAGEDHVFNTCFKHGGLFRM